MRSLSRLFLLHSEQMASNPGSISGDSDTQNAVLISRRSIILTLVASTPTEIATLDNVLQNRYLSTVKLWMDDILKGSVGELALPYDSLYYSRLSTTSLSQKLLFV